VFLSSPHGSLGVTYDVHIMLIGKCVVDVLVITELFLQVLRLRRNERISIENRRFCSNGVSLDQNFRCKWSPASRPTHHFSCRKSRIIVLPCGIRMWAEVSFVLSQCTRLTDRQKCLGNTVRCITCSRMVTIAL